MMQKRMVSALLAVILMSSGLLFDTGVARGALKEGVEAPDFTLKTTTDEEITLSDFRGRIVILHFWKSN